MSAAVGTESARDQFLRTIGGFVDALKVKFRNDPGALERVTAADRRFQMVVVNVSEKMKDAVAKSFVVQFDAEMSPLYDRINKGDETFVRDIRNKMFHEMGFDALFEQSSPKTRAVMVRHIQAICTSALRYLAQCRN
jgi:hypothetical protein